MDRLKENWLSSRGPRRRIPCGGSLALEVARWQGEVGGWRVGEGNNAFLLPSDYAPFRPHNGSPTTLLLTAPAPLLREGNLSEAMLSTESWGIAPQSLLFAGHLKQYPD